MTTTDHKKKRMFFIVISASEGSGKRLQTENQKGGAIKVSSLLRGEMIKPKTAWLVCLQCLMINCESHVFFAYHILQVMYIGTYIYIYVHIYIYIYIYSIYVITIWVCLTYLSGTCWPGSSAMGSKGKCLKYSWDEQLHWWKSCNCSWWQKIIMMAMKYTWNTFQLKPGTMQLFK